MLDWFKLSPERFEQLCVEIIQSEGFYNIRRMGATGDRGRDIIAQKSVSLLYGTKETQNWIIQCKRYINTNLTIDNLGTELNKVRMHKIDYYLLMITNTVNPNLHDWLEQVKNQYQFKILIFDIDWLENLLKKQNSLYRRYFENATDYNYLNPIKTTTDLQIYTAGKMPSTAIRGAITWWRESLENEVSKLNQKLGFFHPEFAGCDHTGIFLADTVEQDFRMIAKSNVVIAYLEDKEQFGTLTEIMIGYSMRKQIAIFIDDCIQIEISEEVFDDYESEIDFNYKEVYQKVFKTEHSCPCGLMNELQPVHMNNYWFMIEFLRLRQPDTFIKVTSKQAVIKDMSAYIKQFFK